jgi:A nuclease family of the HNH/ENDO VII superfamily with conserved AHH
MLSFRSVNGRASVGYRNGWQRHHLIPRQLANHCDAGPVLASLEPFGFSLDDYAGNGMLLPGSELAARASGLPIHTGPHPGYNRRVAAMIADIGRQSAHPLRRFAPVMLLQKDLKQSLALPRGLPAPIDLIDLSMDSQAHRRLDAEVEAILARFALCADIA